jgi:hypothetical protein
MYSEDKLISFNGWQGTWSWLKYKQEVNFWEVNHLNDWTDIWVRVETLEQPRYLFRHLDDLVYTINASSLQMWTSGLYSNHGLMPCFWNSKKNIYELKHCFPENSIYNTNAFVLEIPVWNISYRFSPLVKSKLGYNKN